MNAGVIRSDVGYTLGMATDQDWGSLPAGDVTALAGETWAGLAAAVPFRAGSLSAAGAMVGEIAERGWWRIDWDRTPLIDQIHAVELGHHAATLEQIGPAIDIVAAGLTRRGGGPKPPPPPPDDDGPGGPGLPPPEPPWGPDIDGPELGPRLGL